MTNRDLLTPQDEAYIAAQVKASHRAYGEIFPKPWAPNAPQALSRLLTDMDKLQQLLRHQGQTEAAECLATAEDCIRDAREALK